MAVDAGVDPALVVVPTEAVVPPTVEVVVRGVEPSDVGIVDGEVCGELDAVVPASGTVTVEPDTVVSTIPLAWLFWDPEGAAGL